MFLNPVRDIIWVAKSLKAGSRAIRHGITSNKLFSTRILCLRHILDDHSIIQPYLYFFTDFLMIFFDTESVIAGTCLDDCFPVLLGYRVEIVAVGQRMSVFGNIGNYVSRQINSDSCVCRDFYIQREKVILSFPL